MNRIGQTRPLSNSYRGLALTVLLLLTLPAQAVQTVVLRSDTSELALGSFLSYLEDPSTQQTFADVSTQDDNQWQPSGSAARASVIPAQSTGSR
ncbi:MAG: hypothetical protein R3F37_00280 [Candidatus Competibacteraceae bacterium]